MEIETGDDTELNRDRMIEIETKIMTDLRGKIDEKKRLITFFCYYLWKYF